MDAKKRQEIEKAIRMFHERVSEMERVRDALNDVLSMQPESDLNQAIFFLIGGYTSALDAAYNIGGWLEWWWIECRLGATPHKAGLPLEAMREINSIDSLVEIILDDLERIEQEQQA